MTLAKRLAKQEQKRMARACAIPIPRGLAERLADALTNGREDYHIRDVFNAWKKERGET